MPLPAQFGFPGGLELVIVLLLFVLPLVLVLLLAGYRSVRGADEDGEGGGQPGTGDADPETDDERRGESLREADSRDG